MMIEPPISSLMNKVDNKYTLVVLAAKRARQLYEGAEKFTDCSSEKPVTIAVNEIAEDKITYVRNKNGFK